MISAKLRKDRIEACVGIGANERRGYHEYLSAGERIDGCPSIIYPACVHVTVTVKNYRAFPRSSPAQFVLSDGFTAFVGPNNSGKSSILKLFYELRNLFSQLAHPPAWLNAMGRQLPGTSVFHAAGLSEIVTDGDMGPLVLEFEATGPFDIAPLFTVPNKVIVTLERNPVVFSVKVAGNGGAIDRALLSQLGDSGLRFGAEDYDIRPYLDCFRALTNTLYVGPFRNALNMRGSAQYFDLPVGHEFVAHWANMKSGQNRDLRVAAATVTDSISDIFGFTRLEITATPEKTTLIVAMSNRRSYHLDDVGSGLTQFIVVFAMAASRKPAFILIDEPELSLHPTLQLSFLTNLGALASVGVMFATHSIGLARAGAEAVYTVARPRADEPPRIRLLEDTPRLAEFLGELSIGGYREVGFERVLLVEGPTDIKTFQQLLRILKKDHRVLIMDLGGEGMINGSRQLELAEITRIATPEKTFAVIDSERQSAQDAIPAQRRLFKNVCTDLGIHCHILERRATENYFPISAVRRAFGDREALGAYDALSGRWAKKLNWKIAREMTESDLQETGDLGAVLNQL